MKKITSIVLAMIMCVSLFGCSGKKTSETAAGANTQEETTQQIESTVAETTTKEETTKNESKTTEKATEKSTTTTKKQTTTKAKTTAKTTAKKTVEPSKNGSSIELIKVAGRITGVKLSLAAHLLN